MKHAAIPADRHRWGRIPQDLRRTAIPPATEAIVEIWVSNWDLCEPTKGRWAAPRGNHSNLSRSINARGAAATPTQVIGRWVLDDRSQNRHIPENSLGGEETG
jgi:hypothetical protein